MLTWKRLSSVALLAGSMLGHCHAEIRFPSDSGVLNVAEHGATPDDEVDDTAAIQALLDQHPSGNHVFYFPSGVYLLGETLRPALDDGVTKRNIFQGQSERTTMLKLRDDLNHEDAVIDFRGGPAQFFRNAVRDLTIDIGTGNPRASGLKFNASNQGTVRNVTIRSDDRGEVGLDMSHSGEIGPLLIADVTVDGFARGVFTRWQTASQTVDGLTLKNQGEVGWLNLNAQTVFARRVQSRNQCPAIVNRGEGRMLLVHSRLVGFGDASAHPAIRNQKSMYLRDVDTPGHAQGVTNQLVAGRGNPGQAAGPIAEYWANGADDRRRGSAYLLFPSPDRMLAIATPTWPRVEPDKLADWSGPIRFGGRPDDGIDDTASIQAAIDAGASTVFLSRGTWQLDGVVTVRKRVRRIMGTEARIRGTGKLRIVDGDSQRVVIERLEGATTIEHASQRTLLLEHLLGFSYASIIDHPGDVYFSDVVGKPFKIRPSQHVWARQLDIEGNIEADVNTEARVLNDGGIFSVLGFKTEDEGTHIKTINGGRTEVLGALHVGAFGGQPRFVTIDASITAAIIKGGQNTVLETRGNETRNGKMGNADVYTGFVSD